MSEPGIIEAVVQVGADETRYLRCGRGERVILVLAADDEERLRLLRRFADGCCVIAPVLHRPLRRAADQEAAVEAWLRDVIDGLGLERPAVLLAPDHAWLADRLADGWRERVAAVLTQDS